MLLKHWEWLSVNVDTKDEKWCEDVNIFNKNTIEINIKIAYSEEQAIKHKLHLFFVNMKLLPQI